MSNQIHARKVGGDWLYRVWSTVVDDYVSEEMVKASLLVWLMNEDMEHWLAETEERIQRAKARGTSSHLETRNVDGPWDEPLQDDWDDEEAECAYHAVTGE